MTDPARAFAAKVLRAYDARRPLDEFELQDAGIANGLLEYRTVHKSCGSDCQCDWWDDSHDNFPTECLRLTDAAKALLEEYPE